MKNQLSVLVALILWQVSLPVKAQVVINEVCPANADLLHDPDYFDFPGWVELYNKGTTSANVSGYYLSNDPAARAKWRIPAGVSIPAGGFLIIWCDSRNRNLHTNFTMDADGETLVLSDGGLGERDRLTFPEQYTNISWGRTDDGGTSFGYLASATPAGRNAGATGTQRLVNPVFSVSAGRYASAQSVTMTHPTANVQIRYTTDGSEPDRTSAVYSAPVAVTKTSVLKAKAFLNGYIPSKTEVKSYFISQRAFTLPVVSLSTKPAYLWDNTIGIYITGTNGILGACASEPKNWNQDWDRHAVFEYFDKDGKKYFDQSVDIRGGGNCSRNNPQKSFAIKARDKYGSNTIEHRFFQSKNINEVGSLMLRNSGNDFWYTMFRDGLLQNIPAGMMDVDYMAYQPATVYLNGDYWGIMNIREKIDGDYIEANYGVPKDDIDLLETWLNAIEGSAEHYRGYIDSLRIVDKNSDQGWQFLNRYIDVQEYINYLTTQIYYANLDWPGNNQKFWRQRSTNGKYRWILWDLDFGFDIFNQGNATHPTLEFATDPDNTEWPNPAQHTEHIRLALQFPRFREKFIQTFTASLSTAFHPSRVNNMINSFQNNIRSEIPYHLNKWGGTTANWEFRVELMRGFATQRNAYMADHLRSFFGLGDRVKISSRSFPVIGGGITINGITAPDPVSEGVYFKNIPIDLAPAPAPGYKFSHWKITLQESSPVSVIPRGAVWKYLDQGQQPSSDWNDVSYQDSSWPSGQAELGYGDGDEKTTVSFGANGADKYITTYFRKVFTLSDTVGLQNLTGNVLFDDGIVIYLNGHEVFRNNMPQGAVQYSTLASAAVPENQWFSFSAAKSLLHVGENVLAVEVHQNSVTSSDVSFNLDLSTSRAGAITTITSSTPSLRQNVISDVNIEAYYEPALAVDGIIINEICAADSDVTDDFGETEDYIEVYNTGSQAVDLAGFYVTDNLNNKMKYRIPKGKGAETIVAPGTYKILWADEQTTQGALHLNIKLSGEGESVALYQLSGTALIKVEEINFAGHNERTSWSRIPDKTGPFLMTSTLTPGAANVFTVTSAETEQGDLRVYPNPTDGILEISGGERISSVRVTDVAGRELARYSGTSEFSLATFSSGVYILIIQNGKRTEIRRIVKN